MKSNNFDQSDKNKLAKITETSEPQKIAKNKGGKLKLSELQETNEIEISREATAERPAKRIRFPKQSEERFQLKPEKFKGTQEAIDEWNAQCRRERAVYDTSLESCVGYSSLFRVMHTYLSDRVSYYRSAEGGALSFEEARERVYNTEVKDEAAYKELFENIMTIPVDWISFSQLWELSRESASSAENVWEWIKGEARNEFESGHLAAESLEPIGRVKQAWTRAKYVAIRESFSSEYEPKGGIELSMIDLLSQSWFMVQYWTKELSQRMMTEPRRLPHEYLKQKEWYKKANPKAWEEEKWYWETPAISESAAIEQAAQMLDRFQRMYFRALRQLRDWRRYNSQLTINNPKQVNIATDRGQQLNVSNNESE